MNRSPKSSIIIVSLVLLAAPVFAQFEKLRDFGNPALGINTYASLVTDGTFLYGTAVEGGAGLVGVVYKIKPDGSEFSVIHDFNTTDGSKPFANLLYDGGVLYGTTLTGGEFGQGTIFKLNPDGSGFAKLFDFDYFASGAYPYGSLTTDGTTLYGVTTQGGASFYGTVFKINKNGTGHTKLVEFDGNNSNGLSPHGGLIYNAGYLYGLAKDGGLNFSGTAYRVKTDGTGFEVILQFNNSGNGSAPLGSFFFDGTFLWATTYFGGAFGNGTLFRMHLDGSAYEHVMDFKASINGSFPKGTLISDGTFLYGTTAQGGSGGRGTVFKVQLDATNFSIVSDLTGDSSGDQPQGTLLLIGSTLYGTRSSGGFSSRGDVYKVNTNGTSYEELHSFQVEGTEPTGAMIYDGDFFYGLTSTGGLYDDGTMYKIRPDGTDYELLLDFEETTSGYRPMGSLYRLGSTLYGMTQQGGVDHMGIMYKIETNGTGFTRMLDFDDTNNGSFPTGGFTSDGIFLYGMTTSGGTNAQGTIFKIMPNGTGYTRLHDFGGTDGSSPGGSLLIDGTVLYGFATQGGDTGNGTVFKIGTDGNNYEVLADFDYSNGSNPYGSPYSDGTFLYGITSIGGAHNRGTAFKVKTDGTSFQSLFDFDDISGSDPLGSFVSDGTYLYSATRFGGVAGNGTLFRIKTDGSGFDKLIDFNDGGSSGGALFSDGTFLYGTTAGGGEFGRGTLFRRSLADFVSITNFFPESGVAGTYVTINGNDFDPVISHNVVRFNGVSATIVSASVSTIVAIVPDGATNGPITVSSNTTDVSIQNFSVDFEAIMFDGGIVQTCDVVFTEGNGSDDMVETFIPGTPGGKIKVTFTELDIDDGLMVYDGPDETSPLVITLSSGDTEFEYVSKSPGGELTFRFNWQDGSSNWEADIECVFSDEPIEINTQPGNVEICSGLVASISTATSGPSNITYQWQFSDDGIEWNDISNDGGYSNVTTSTLSINTTENFGAGNYRCRVNANGAAEVITDAAELTINSSSGAPCTASNNLIIYNAVSPNGDGKNEFLILESIDVLPATKDNVVKIFNRWGDEVFSVTNYNNNDRVFNGVNKNGNKLPSGVYYYKISFGSGADDLTGYLQLKN